MYKRGRKQLNTALHISLKLLFLWGEKSKQPLLPPSAPRNPEQPSFLSETTATPAALGEHGSICIMHERNAVPLSERSNAFCRTLPSQQHTAAGWAPSLTPAWTTAPLASRGTFRERKTFVFLTRIGFTPASCAAVGVRTHPGPRPALSRLQARGAAHLTAGWAEWNCCDLHWCKRPRNEGRGKQDWAQTDLYIK